MYTLEALNYTTNCGTMHDVCLFGKSQIFFFFL